MRAIADHPRRRWGTARKPRAWSCSQSARVASIPFAGEAVDETVAPAGRKAAWSIEFLSGMSSKVGAVEDAGERRGMRVESERRRRKSMPRPRSRASKPSALDELEQRFVDCRVDGRRLVLGERPLPDLVRPLGGVERAVLLPLLVAVVVGNVRAVEGALEVGQRVRIAEVSAGPARLARIASSAWPFSVMSTPLTSTCIIPHWSAVEDELLVADGEPALEPAGGVQDEVDPGEDRRLRGRRGLVGGLGVGDLRGAQSEPPERNGTPSRRASAAITYSTSAGSGVPNVGAPDCIDIELAKRPEHDRAPGRTSWTKVIPPSASASVCVAEPGHGDRRHRPGQDERGQQRSLVGLA